MNKELDKNGVIEALTDGIGGILGRKARSSYYKLVERLYAMPRFKTHKPIMQQHILDILALSVVHSQIVVPLESSRGFIHLTREAGATHVRVGNDVLDSRFSVSANRCANRFHEMLGESEIPAELLAFSNLKELMENVFFTIAARGSSK
jgi:hypothetical protein